MTKTDNKPVGFNNDFDLAKHTIILTVAGSRAYGIHTATSDVDVTGCAVPPIDFYLGSERNFEQANSPTHMEKFFDLLTGEEKEISRREKLEGTVYAFRKFIGLAKDNNPNIMDILFTRDAEVRKLSKAGELLRANRDMFISAKCKHTYAGYAYAQLKRIMTHKKWIMNPPAGRPDPKDYDLFEGIPQNQLSAALAASKKIVDGWELDLSRLEKSERQPIIDQIREFMAELSITADDKWRAADRLIGYSDNFLVILEKHRAFQNDLDNWGKYQQWLKGRNEARAKLEEKYGYDTKHGAHLVRLLRMGKEILTTGKINVWRGDIDGEELQAIRHHGIWPYEQLIEWAEAQNAELTRMYKAKEYVVPYEPDREAIHNLTLDVTGLAFTEQGIDLSYRLTRPESGRMSCAQPNITNPPRPWPEES